MNIKTQRLISLGLSVINIAGIVGTFIFVSKEAPKAQEELNKLPKDAKKIDKVKTFVKNYKKSLIFATGAVISGIGSRFVSAKTEASLIATATMLDASYRKYRDKVKQALGMDTHKNIVKEMLKDEEKPEVNIMPKTNEKFFVEEHLGYFYADPEKLYKAVNIMNEIISGNCNYYVTGVDSPGSITLREFIHLADIKLLKPVDENILNMGWNCDYLEFGYGYAWVHIDIDEDYNDIDARLITFYEDVIWNPDMWYDYYYGDTTEREYFKGCPEYISKNASYYIKGGNK